MVRPASRAPPIEELIGDIYEAALHPDRWNQFLDHLSAGLSDSFVLLGVIHRRPPNSRNLAMFGLSDDAIHAYRNHFIRLNPWIGALSEAALEQPVVVRDLTDDASVVRGEFFQDWLRHQPAQHPTSLLTVLNDASRICLTVVHHSDSSGNEGELAALLRTLAPHMTRAAQMMQLHDVEPRRDPGDTVALDMLSMGVIYTDRDAKVVTTNALANEILRAADGLRYGTDGRLTACRGGDTERLQSMIRGAAVPAGGGPTASGGSMSLTRDSVAGRMAILVAPIPPSAGGQARGSARVVVFVRRNEDRARLDLVGLAALLDVTTSEAAIAALVTEGASLADIAVRRGVSVSTVRGQVKAILTKTGTHSQADLVRLLMQCGLPLR